VDTIEPIKPITESLGVLTGAVRGSNSDNSDDGGNRGTGSSTIGIGSTTGIGSAIGISSTVGIGSAIGPTPATKATAVPRGANTGPLAPPILPVYRGTGS